MKNETNILLIGGDAATFRRIAKALGEEDRGRLIEAGERDDLLRMIGEKPPHLIIAASPDGAGTMIPTLRSILEEPERPARELLLVTDPQEHQARATARKLGVSGFLIRPVDPPQIQTLLERIARSRVIEWDLVKAGTRIEELEQKLTENLDRPIEMLMTLLDMRFPGSSERGERIAELSQRLAERLRVPEPLHRELEIVARLSDVGKLVAPSSPKGPHQPQPNSEGWRVVLFGRAILRQVEGLEEVAELTGAIYENWDGSGLPDHLEQGQIPLRTRIVRILVDLFDHLEARGGGSNGSVMDEILSRSGTCYDPKVVVGLKAIIDAYADRPWGVGCARMPITQLDVGMKLADDLYTDSGLKLLAKDTELTLATLETIRWRHQFDPIVRGVVVYRKSA